MKRIKNIFKFKKSFSFCLVLDRLAESFCLLAIFFIPIYLSFFLETEHTFELNKVFLLKLLLSLLFLVTAIREIFFPSKAIAQLKHIFLKYWFWPSLFILFLLFSLLFSSDPVISFWGAIDRQQGVISYLFYFFCFILLSFNLIVLSEREPNELDREMLNKENKYYFSSSVKRIIYSIFLSVFVVSLYGVLQFLGIDYYHWQEPAFLTGRAFSFLGQPNFFASWLLLSIPLVIWLIFIVRNKWLKLFCLLSSLLTIFALISSSSRAAIFALMITVFIFILLLFFFNKFKFTFKKFILLFGIIIFLLLSVLSLELILPGRISSVLNFKEGSVAARVNSYQTSVLAIKQKPFFGHGQENLYGVFMSYYQPNWANYSYIGQVPDKAHNLILDILMSLGLLGLLSYFFLYRYYFLLVYRNIKRNEFFSLSLVLGLGVLSYLLSLLFGFAIVSTEFYFFIFLAILVFINYQLKKSDNEGVEVLKEKKYLMNNKKKIYFQVSLSFLVVLISFFTIFRSVNSVLADFYFSESKKSFTRGDIYEAMTFLDYIDKLKINPIAKAHYSELSSAWILPLFPFKEELVLNRIFTERLESSFNNLRESQPKELLMKARIANAFKDFSQREYFLNKFNQNYSTWPLGILAEAKIRNHAGEKNLALERLEFLLENIADPDNPVVNEEHREGIKSFRKETLYLMAGIYESLEEYLLAEKYYRLAYLENPMDYSLLKKIADMLYLEKEFSQALIEVEKGLRLSPNDYTWPLLASYLYQELGDSEAEVFWQQKAVELGFVLD